MRILKMRVLEIKFETLKFWKIIWEWNFYENQISNIKRWRIKKQSNTRPFGWYIGGLPFQSSVRVGCMVGHLLGHLKSPWECVVMCMKRGCVLSHDALLHGWISWLWVYPSECHVIHWPSCCLQAKINWILINTELWTMLFSSTLYGFLSRGTHMFATWNPVSEPMSMRPFLGLAWLNMLKVPSWTFSLIWQSIFPLENSLLDQGFARGLTILTLLESRFHEQRLRKCCCCSVRVYQKCLIWLL